MLIFTVLTPIVLGAATMLFRFKTAKWRQIYLFSAVLLTSILTYLCIFTAPQEGQTLLQLTKSITCTLKLDGMGKIFAGLIAILWPLAMLYAFEYMEHEGGENVFFTWYVMTYGVTLGIAMAGDLITLYLFYEFLTLCTLPLVMHGMSHHSVAAGLKYLYYSLAGAGMAFIGVVLILFYGSSTAFVPGGVLSALPGNRETLLRAGYVLAFLGFGVKAAVFPFHGWLPTASIAPTPVTALLHAVAVVKAGVFAVMRITYQSFGTELLRGTFAQYIPVALAIFTLVYGSIMAVREQHLKRRLAYSTISNLSYILFGTLLMTPAGLTGALTHMVFHALMKILLFCAVGAVLVKTEKQFVQDIRGLGKRMPLTVGVFVLGSLAMVGIPPFVGFQSKWMLLEAALETGTWMGYLGIAALLISALLTAVYLLTPAFQACFSKPNQGDAAECCEAGWRMKAPFLAWAVFIIILSFAAQPLVRFISSLSIL